MLANENAQVNVARLSTLIYRGILENAIAASMVAFIVSMYFIDLALENHKVGNDTRYGTNDSKLL